MPIEWAMKEDTTPKQTESNNKDHGGGFLRRRGRIIRLKKNEICGIIIKSMKVNIVNIGGKVIIEKPNESVSHLLNIAGIKKVKNIKVNEK